MSTSTLGISSDPNSSSIDPHVEQRSFERFKPDMLLVLGDISARGSELTKSKWSTVLQQFESMLGPFMGLPLHIVLGDRDIGKCNELDEQVVGGIASRLPGLDSSGCSAFEIGNISFVSLNAVALLCGNNELRFDVEKAIERESVDLQTQVKDATDATEPNEKRSSSSSSPWRINDMAAGSGPVLLLHFPLHQKMSKGRKIKVVEQDRWHDASEDLRSLGDSDVDMGPYDFEHSLPVNATEYIFQALKPRIVFSAHTHIFCDHAHSDGTREVTVPAMTWAARGKPGFVVVTFGQNKAVTVNQCSLATESQVMMAYMFVFILSLATIMIMRQSHV